MTERAPKSILILRLSALGDVIHTLPAVQSLRAGYPEVPIGWVVERPYTELVRKVAPVDEVFEVSTRRWRQNITASETRADLSAIRRELKSFSAGGWSVDFQGLVKSAVIGGIAGADVRIGFDREVVRERASMFLTTRRVSVDPSGHVVELNRRLAREIGGAPITSEPPWDRFADDPTGRLAFHAHGSYVVLLPGTGQARKCWPPERFAALAGIITEEFGLEVLVVPGPGEEPLANDVAARARVTVVERTTLPELASLLSKARLVVGGDTGPIHLADSIGSAVVAIFGPTDPARNGPFNQLDSVVSSFHGDQMMESIAVEDVAAAVRKRLEASAGKG